MEAQKLRDQLASMREYEVKVGNVPVIGIQVDAQNKVVNLRISGKEEEKKEGGK